MTVDAVGGVWQYATELAAGLRAHDIQVTLALLGPTASKEQLHTLPSGVALVETGLPLDWLADGPQAVIAAAERLASLTREIDADLVQLNSPSLAAAADFPCPVVVVAHGCIGTWWDVAEAAPLPDVFGWQVEMIRAGLVAAAAVVTPTAAFGKTVQQRYGLGNQPVAIHNGRSPLMSANSDGLANHVFTAGRLWDRVKATPLLDAIAALLNVPFRAAGPVVAPHGEAVTLRHLDHLGTVSDRELAAELALRPIFVSAATFEPFGLAVLEAAQAGCALVLSDIPTFRELWDGAAVFVTHRDPRQWAEAIEKLLPDTSRRTALGQAARERAGRYTPFATASAMAGLYAGLLPRPRRAAA